MRAWAWAMVGLRALRAVLLLLLLVAASCGQGHGDAGDVDAPHESTVATRTARSFGGFLRLPVERSALRGDGPAAVAFAGGVYTVVRDADDRLHTYLFSRFTGWLDLGVDAPGVVAASKPALTVTLDQVLTAVRGPDSAIHLRIGGAASSDLRSAAESARAAARRAHEASQRASTPRVEPTWFTLPGRGFTSAPALASDGALLYAFAARADGILYESHNDLGQTQPASYVHARWTPWKPLLGARVSSDPAASAWAGGIEVVVRGADRRLFSVSVGLRGASSWRVVGDVPVASAPALAAVSAGLIMFARGMDGACWLSRRGPGGLWSPFAPLRGRLLGSAPGAAFDAETRDLFVFAAGQDLAVYVARAHRARS